MQKHKFYDMISADVAVEEVKNNQPLTGNHGDDTTALLKADAGTSARESEWF